MFIYHYKKGFTLIEIMIVMFIISIAIGFIQLNFGRDNHQQAPIELFLSEAKQLISYAQQQAIFQYEEYGVDVMPNGLLFMRYQYDLANVPRWQSLLHDSVLDFYSIPSRTFLQMKVSGEKIAKRVSITDPTKSAKPVIFLTSNGEMTPFTLTLISQDGKFARTLRGDANGVLEIVPGIGNTHG